jgi:YVTN family beta-propeller protein
VGQRPLAVAVDEPRQHVFVTNGGVWATGYVVPLGTVSLLDARSGTVLRTVRVGKGAVAVAVDAHRGYAVITNSYDGTVSVLNARTGAVVHTVAVGRNPGPIAVNEQTGVAFVANEHDDSVSMVDVASGRVVRTVPLARLPCALAVDQRRDSVLVLTRQSLWPSPTVDQMAVLDGRSGRLRYTVGVGAHAGALAVDERTGHAFATAMNVDGKSAVSDSRHLLQAWLRHQHGLPWSWVSQLLPPVPTTTMGTVTMLDLAHVPA